MEKILVAFSGGPDSVYTYYYLKNKGYDLGICYINHNLRNDVYKDIEFVENFANKENIKCYIENIYMEKFSEDLARNLRYEKLEKIRKENKYKYIATGHNKNDNVETIIFRLIRGTGIEGLKGIKEKRGNIIRPILSFSKEEILSYLNENNIEYLEDYTNKSNDYSRNIIRNKMLPIMKEINSNYLDNISNLINQINENSEEKEKIRLELEKYNISYNKRKIDSIYAVKNKVGSKIDLDNKYFWYTGYNYYGIKEKEEKILLEYELKIGKSIKISEYTFILDKYSNIKNELEKKLYRIYNVGNVESLVLRSKKDGDKIDNTKLKKLFINKKIDKLDREKIILICDKNEVLIALDVKISKKINKNIEKDSICIAIFKEE